MMDPNLFRFIQFKSYINSLDNFQYFTSNKLLTCKSNTQIIGNLTVLNSYSINNNVFT